VILVDHVVAAPHVVHARRAVRLAYPQALAVVGVSQVPGGDAHEAVEGVVEVTNTELQDRSTEIDGRAIFGVVTPC